MKIWALIAVVASALTVYCSAAIPNEASYVKGYLGEPVDGLTHSELDRFNEGFLLFVKQWDASPSNARNERSCVGCHSIPMPGGSGTDSHTFARIDARSPSGPVVVVQKNASPRSSDIFELVKARPLFGLGYIEAAASPRNPFVIGTFGTSRTIKDFVAKAFAVELGLSSKYYCASLAKDRTLPASCTADIDEGVIDSVAFYLQALAPPNSLRRNEIGKAIFNRIGCGACHLERLTTGQSGLAVLSERTINVYSDLQLHNVIGNRSTRTAPLWGLNSFGPPYMHNGCGTSILAAIQCHSKEAAKSRRRFDELPTSQKTEVLNFLKDL